MRKLFALYLTLILCLSLSFALQVTITADFNNTKPVDRLGTLDWYIEPTNGNKTINVTGYCLEEDASIITIPQRQQNGLPGTVRKTCTITDKELLKRYYSFYTYATFSYMQPETIDGSPKIVYYTFPTPRSREFKFDNLIENAIGGAKDYWDSIFGPKKCDKDPLVCTIGDFCYLTDEATLTYNTPDKMKSYLNKYPSRFNSYIISTDQVDRGCLPTASKEVFKKLWVQSAPVQGCSDGTPLYACNDNWEQCKRTYSGTIGLYPDPGCTCSPKDFKVTVLGLDTIHYPDYENGGIVRVENLADRDCIPQIQLAVGFTEADLSKPKFISGFSAEPMDSGDSLELELYAVTDKYNNLFSVYDDQYFPEYPLDEPIEKGLKLKYKIYAKGCASSVCKVEKTVDLKKTREPKLKIMSSDACSKNDGKCGPLVCGDTECVLGEKCEYGKWFTLPVYGDVGAGCGCRKNDECPQQGGPCLGTPIGECNQQGQRCSSTLEGVGVLGPVEDLCSPCSLDDLKLTFGPYWGGKYINYPGSISYSVVVENLGASGCVTPDVYLEFGFGNADVKYRFKDYTLSNKRLAGKSYYHENWARAEIKVDASEKNELSVSWASEDGESDLIKTYESEEVNSFIAKNDKFKYRAYLEGGTLEQLKEAPLRRRSEPHTYPKYSLDGIVNSKADTIYFTATAKYSDGLKVIAETGDGLKSLGGTNLKKISEEAGRTEYIIDGDPVKYKIEYMCIKEGETDFSIKWEKGDKPVPVETDIDALPFTRTINCEKALEIRPGCKVKLEFLLGNAGSGNKIFLSVLVRKIDDCICPSCKVKFYVDQPEGQTEYTVESKEKNGIEDYIYDLDTTDMPVGEYTFYAIAYAPDGTQMSDKSELGVFKVKENIN